MKRERTGWRPQRSSTHGISLATALIVATAWIALGPSQAVTVSKLNVRNTFSSSTNQQVKLYGLPVLTLDSPTTDFTTKAFDNRSYKPFPYSTSTNTRADFKLSSGSILNGEFASSTVSSTNTAALSVSDWAWYGGSTGTTRLGAVPDPSVSRQEGPRGIGNDPTTQLDDWISINVTFTNTVRPTQIVDDVFTGALPRPTARISYMDFGYGAYRSSRSSEEIVQIEQYLAQQAILKVNPRSSGQLAQAFQLQRQCTSGYLNSGQSCAGDGDSATLFVAPIALLADQAAPIPGPSEPVTAHLVAATAGSDGVDPRNTMDIQSASRRITSVTLGPGASVTFQVRAIVGAFELQNPFKPLVVARMRESSLQNGVEVSEAVFSGCAELPRAISIGQIGGGQSQPTEIQPRSRQEWAHLLKLYNRSLRLLQRAGDAPLRTGRF